MLDMPLGELVPRAKIALVSMRVAAAYAASGDRTLPRDLNTLVKAGLLLKRKNSYKANLAVILGRFVPTFERFPERQ